jgi:hypothetical protein
VFVDETLLDYRLQAISPVIEYGPDPAGFGGTPQSDLDGGPRLRDHDGDGLAVVDVAAYERDAGLTPGDVPNVRWTTKTLMEWDIEPSATSYHVYRDTLDTLGYDHFGSCADGLDPVRDDLELVDEEVPATETCFFYLITADDGSHGAPNEGTLGFGSAAERSNFPATACTVQP